MKHILPLLLVLFSVSAYADKYDDLVVKMRTQTPNIAFYNYQQYQKANPQIGNVYYQLGSISYDYLRQINPIYDLKAFRYYAYNSKLYYGNCLHFATDNDVRKYAAHYTGVKFSKKPSVKDLESHIRPILKDIATITEAGNKLNATFVQLLSRYERCIEIYLALNTKFGSFNDALLQAQSDDLAAMHELQTISDSIPTYITLYQNALAAYKIKGYNPTFKIVPIELFRIDALCSVNFLENQIALYDFGAWVRQFNTRRDTRVMPILAAAQKAYKQLMSGTDYQAPVSLINSLYQLDQTSYPASVLQIRSIYNQVTTNREKFSNATTDKRLAMLYDMNIAVQSAHEQHTRLKTLTATDMQKYADFTTQYFPQAMPYAVLQSTVTQTRSMYNVLLQDFRREHTPQIQLDPNTITIPCGEGLDATLTYQSAQKRNQLTIASAGRTIIKTNINIDKQPQAMFYLQDVDQLIFAHPVLNDNSLVEQTRFTIYDLRNNQLTNWVTLPLIDRIAYITTTEDGYALVINEGTTKAVTLYTVTQSGTFARHPILSDAATIVGVGHYTSDAFVLYALINEKPKLLLVDKR